MIPFSVPIVWIMAGRLPAGFANDVFHVVFGANTAVSDAKNTQWLLGMMKNVFRSTNVAIGEHKLRHDIVLLEVSL